MSEHHHHEDDHDHDHDHDDDAPLQALPPTPVHGYWKTLAELEGKADFQTNPTIREFPQEDASVRPIDPLSRRNFMQFMGASMGLAGVGAMAAGCRRYEKEEIVPLSRRPEDQTPGQTQEYATVFDLGGVAHPLIATAFEGRPIKLDGNPEHPWNGGGIVPGTERHAGISTFASASILHLFDPDRSQTVLTKGQGSSLDSFRSQLDTIRGALNGSARILSEATSSPTVARLKRELLAKYPGLQWVEYEAISFDNEREGTRQAFGRPVRPIAKLDKAMTIVALDADLFVEHPAAARYNRDFALSRRLNGSLGMGKMNRLWSIESVFSNTGAMADHRLALRSELGLPFILGLEAAVATGAGANAEVLKEAKVAKFLQVLADELKANKGKAVIVAGRRQPAEVHAAVARINAALNAPLDYVEDPDQERTVTHAQAIAALGHEMTSGKVSTLIMIGGNPVYDAPVDAEFEAGLAKVATSIHLHDYQNETSVKSSWHVPRAHFLEAWGDARSWDGTTTLAQPLIAPLFGGLSTIELLTLLLKQDATGETQVKATVATAKPGADWRTSIHDGFVGGSAPAVLALQAPNPAAAVKLTDSQTAPTKRANGDLEVVFHYSSSTYDGRFANNGWLQETPDFLTKVTWDNYALVGPETSEVLGLPNDTMIRVTVNGKSIDLPCYTIPGQARYSIGLVLGGGRTKAGRVGGSDTRESVGWNTNKVRFSTGFDIAGKAKAESLGTAYELADTQEHWDIRTGISQKVTTDGIAERLPELIKITTPAMMANQREKYHAQEKDAFFPDRDLKANTDEPGEGGKSLFKEKDYTGHRWGMAIDLSSCTGCNACMVACQSENNVPVVGRKEVINNREMSWIRIDRYFSGTPDEPMVVHQPIGCQQCEQAPCEQVCPVGATSHSEEGLNDMAYNRCIGTRYCANNCPYKVRRFNFLDWNKQWRDDKNKLRRLLFNPDVTVRMRGVMEKCTFCVQRIQNGKIKAKAAMRSGQRPSALDRPLPDGEIESACQQACPTEAIVFGDLSDPTSRVSKAHADRRAYDLLEETYTKPRNRFLARVRNQNPGLLTSATGTSNQGGHE